MSLVITLVPQICLQCVQGNRDRTPKAVVKEMPGWGKEGNMTFYELECGHQWLMFTNFDGSV